MANVLITFLSKFIKTDIEIQEVEYSSDIGLQKGILSNEAATKYFIEYLAKEGDSLDKIIYIATNEVQQDVHSKYKKTAEEFFKEKIIKFAKDYKSTENIEFIPINYDLDSKKLNSTISRIVDEIKIDDNIYIDTTGGTRDVAYMLILICKILEYKGNKIKNVIYSEYKNNNSRIKKIKDIYDLFELISGVNEFISFGSSKTLINSFSNTCDKDIKNLIEHMNIFSENIKLCKTNNLENNLKNIKECLNKIENKQYLSEKETLFVKLISVIKRKFGIEKEQSFNCIALIRWCVENDLIQQALTIYTEQISKYIFDNKIVICINENLEKVDFYKDFLEMYKNNSKTNKIKKFLKTYKNSILELNNENIMDFVSSDIKQGMENIFLLKQYITIYGDNYNTIKSRMKKDKKDEVVKILEYMKSKLNLPQKIKFDKILNSIISSISYEELIDPDLFEKSKTETKMNTFNKKILTIKNYENLIEESDFKVNQNYDIKGIMSDYVIIKSMRNKINHASEDENLNEEQREFFNMQGYNLSDNLHISEIKEIILNALDRLKIKNPK